MIPVKAPGFWVSTNADSYVSLWCRFNESAGTTTITDSSKYNHTFDSITSTDFEVASSPQVFGSNIGWFKRVTNTNWAHTSGDPSSVLQLGTGDFTIELCFYLISTGDQGLIEGRQPGTLDDETWAILALTGTNEVQLLEMSSTGVVNSYSFGNASTGEWWYASASRTSGTISGYMGLVADVTASRKFNVSSSFAYNAGSPAYRGIYLGANTDSQKLSGYLDGVRITKGVGRYSGTSMTIPTNIG